MIPRILVPVNVRPVTPDEAKKTGHRTTTYMDDRTVVPSGLSDAPPLNGKSNIPAHLPLGVLVNRTLVERGMPAKPFEHLTPCVGHHSRSPSSIRAWSCQPTLSLRAGRTGGIRAHARADGRAARGNRAGHFHHRRRQSADRTGRKARRTFGLGHAHSLRAGAHRR